MKILLTGHGCGPDLGSEPGVTWNWALHLAARNDVWVVTHAHFRPAIERHLAVDPQPRLRFVYTGRLGWWDPLRLPSLRGIRIHYAFWLRRVLRLARELDAEHGFDVVHHVSWNTVSAPPLLWRLGKPFVWGPVGGGQTTPAPLLGCFGAGAPLELLRTLRVGALPLVPAVRRAAARADSVFAANRETASTLRRAGRAAAPLLLDCAVPKQMLDAPPAPPRPADGRFTVLWVGRIEPRKALGLCLETARLVADPDVGFVVVGDGPGAAAARRRARRMGLDGRVEFVGQLPWREVQALFRSAHLLLFTSVRDTSGNVALEALAGGTPVVCIDHQGLGAHLPQEAAVKVPVGRPRAVAAAMARAVDDLARDRARLAGMARAGRRYVEREDWDRRAAAMEAHYRSIVEPRRGAPAGPGGAAACGAEGRGGDHAGCG